MGLERTPDKEDGLLDQPRFSDVTTGHAFSSFLPAFCHMSVDVKSITESGNCSQNLSIDMFFTEEYPLVHEPRSFASGTGTEPGEGARHFAQEKF